MLSVLFGEKCSLNRCFNHRFRKSEVIGHAASLLEYWNVSSIWICRDDIYSPMFIGIFCLNYLLLSPLGKYMHPPVSMFSTGYRCIWTLYHIHSIWKCIQSQIPKSIALSVCSCSCKCFLYRTSFRFCSSSLVFSVFQHLLKKLLVS